MKRNKVFGLLMMLAIVYCFCGCSDDSVENRSPAPVQNSMAASSPASSAKSTATPWKAPTATPIRFKHRKLDDGPVYYEWLYDSKTDSYQYHFLGKKDGTKCKKRVHGPFARFRYDRKKQCLTIFGKGRLYSDAYYEADYPQWRDDDRLYNIEYPFPKNKVKKLVIRSGVTEINIAAFAKFKKLESVTLPDSLTRIKKYAFVGCKKLKKIRIPDNVKWVGDECFWQCRSLEKVKIGKAAARIGQLPFYQCPQLNYITVVKGNPRYEMKDGVLYDDKYEAAIYGYNDMDRVVIRYGTKKVARLAFAHHRSLKQVRIPASVEILGGGCFYACTELVQVDFAVNSRCRVWRNFPGIHTKDVYEDEYYYMGCFGECVKLREIHIPDSVVRIGFPFEGWKRQCSSLERVYIGRNVHYGVGNSDISDCFYWGIKEGQKLYYVVSPQNPYYYSRNGKLYKRNGKRIGVF